MDTTNQFQPAAGFAFDINRAERCQQVHLLVPLLDQPAGRAWFLQHLAIPGGQEETERAEVFHLCFPLRDIFTADYYQCRGMAHLEDQLIAYYNALFGLPVGFGVNDVWRTTPGGELRHPGAPGRSGWHDTFLQERIAGENLRRQAQDVRRTLGTEVDILLVTQGCVVLVECKFLSGLSQEQHTRLNMMGKTLASRLGKDFHFGLVIDDEADLDQAHIGAPFVRWPEIEERLEGLEKL